MGKYRIYSIEQGFLNWGHVELVRPAGSDGT